MSEENAEESVWISQLGRLYREADRVSGNPQGANQLAEQFNEVLEKLQEEFPDNEVVQSTDTIQTRARLQQKADIPLQVRTECGKLADVIGYELPEEELDKEGTGMPIIRVNQKQESEQNVTQSVTVESTMELINYISRDTETENELRQLVEDFQEELESEDPDESSLRGFIKQVDERSSEVAANLAIIALQKGLIKILGLG